MRTLAFAALAAGLLTTIACQCPGQISPERTYYGVNRSIPMTVTTPADLKGEAEIRLLEPVTAMQTAKASVVAGKVDLAALFPGLWGTIDPATKKPDPTIKPRLVYAQLFVGEKKVGPAVVLQPMLQAPRARLDKRNPQQPQVVYPDSDQATHYFAGLRAYVDKRVVMETDKGTIEMALRPDVAPNTAWFFREFVEGGFYTDIAFHRVVAVSSEGKPFVIQGGDPTGSGDGGPGFEYALEPSTLPHDFGVVSMARDEDPNTNGSQFFICLSREGTAKLDGRYCAFAECVNGADVIRRIAQTPLAAGERDKPMKPPRIKSARLVDAPPYGEGPKPLSEQAAQPPVR